jgi:hypothetical protein
MEKEVTPNPIPKKTRSSSITIKNPSTIKTQKPKPFPKKTNTSPITIQRIPLPITQRTDPKKVKYKYAGKESLAQIIAKSIPRKFIPTKRMGEIFGYIFLAVLIIAALVFPYGSLVSGNVDIALKVGVPFTFLELNAHNPTKIPVKFGALIIDLIIYLILAYLIEIGINMVLKSSFFGSKEDRKKHPKMFKNRKAQTIADKITKKIIREPPMPIPPKPKIPKKPKSPTSPVASPKSKTTKAYSSKSTP